MFLHAITAVAPAASTAGHWVWDRSQSAMNKAFKLVVKAPNNKPAANSSVQVSHRLVRIPGLIDVHVHLCEPCSAYKEDFASGTAAALSGGVTMVLAMPDTKPAIADKAVLYLAKDLARKGARCDYAFFMGATSSNYDEIPDLASHVVGLKMYLGETFTSLKLDGIQDWLKHFEHWPKEVPICVHAEGRTTAAVLLLASLHNRPVHVCHVATKEEIEVVKAAKKRGLPITCEVCPHHLFLTDNDVASFGSKGIVCPRLASAEDQKALWDNMDIIDCFATSHTPHNLDEKTGEPSSPGYPGLETMLPLLLTAVNQGRLTLQDVVNKCYYNPKRIFKLPEQPDTYVEVDLEEEWVLPNAQRFSKAKWSPFGGWKVKGAVKRVVLRGQVAYADGSVTAQPGFGQNIREPTDQPTLAISHLEPATDVNESRSSRLRTKSASEQQARVEDEIINVQRRNSETRDIGQLISELGIAKPRALSVGPTLPVRSAQQSQQASEPIYRAVSPATRMLGSSSALSPTHQQPKSVSIRPMSSASSSQSAGTPVGAPAHGLQGQSLLTVDMFTRDQLNAIFNLAQTFRLCVHKERSLDHILKGKLLASVFYETSTITSSSFSAAMQRLGGRVIYIDENSSSVRKGETLEDSITVLSSYSDVVVLRHPEVGTAERAAIRSKCPLINAGDGIGEHPTQAVLDIFTMREEIGTVNGLTVTLVGDLKHGRTVHSLAKLLTHYNVQLRYVSLPELAMPEDVMNYVGSKGITQMQYTSLEDALPDTDVLYMTRIQHERFPSQEEYDMACGHFIVTPQLMRLAKRRMIVMHPLPRVFEISTDFDSDPRAAYFRQAEAGVYVRMALLAMVLGKC